MNANPQNNQRNLFVPWKMYWIFTPSEYDEKNPWVCFDESCKQLVKEIKETIPPEQGKPQRYDYQYERNGVANLFMFKSPLQGWRHVEVTKQKTAIDYAHQMKYLVDECYPDADKIRVIQDNLNTHVKASLYKAFKPEEAKRILDKLEFHYTPKHGRHVKYGGNRIKCLEETLSINSNLTDH